MTPRTGSGRTPARRRRPVAEAIAEAEHPATSPERLAELAAHTSEKVRNAAAAAPRASDETVRVLAHDDSDWVRGAAASNAAGRPSVEADLAGSPDKWVRAILAHTYALEPHKQLLRATQEVLAADSFRDVRQRIAETTAYRELYERLLGDPDPRVRGACASNPRASAEDMERLLTDRHRDTRAMALDGGARLTHEQLMRAARDSSADVRFVTLYRPGSPDAVAYALSDDADDTVREAARAGARDRADIWDPAGEADAIAQQQAATNFVLTWLK